MSEVSVKEGTFTRNGETMPFLSGEMIVKVELPVNGEVVENDIPVQFFASKYNKNGEESKAYKAIQDLQTNYISIAASDINTADRIRITTGSLQENAYYGRNGNLVSFPRIQANFWNKVSKTEMKPEARFTNVICIGGIREEVDRDGTPTGAIIVQGIIPQYGGRVDLIDFKATSKEAVDHITSNWSKGDTVQVNGKCLFSSKVEYVEEAVGFGEPVKTARTTHVSELLITSGSAGSMEGDQAFDVTEIASALNHRKTRLEELKRKSTQREAQSNNRPARDLGF